MVVFLVSLQCGLNKIGNHSKGLHLGCLSLVIKLFFCLKDFSSYGRNSKTELRFLRGNWLLCATEQVEEGGHWGWVSYYFTQKGWVSSIWYLSRTEEYKCGNSRFTAGRTREGLLGVLFFWESGSVEKMQGSGAVLWFCLHFVITNYSWLLCMLTLFLPMEIKCGPSVLPCILLHLRKGSQGVAFKSPRCWIKERSTL